MKTKEEISRRLAIETASIDDLDQQREQNAAKGNWTIVKAIKESIAIVNHRKRVLEWVLSDEV